MLKDYWIVKEGKWIGIWTWAEKYSLEEIIKITKGSPYTPVSSLSDAPSSFLNSLNAIMLKEVPKYY